MSQISKVMVVGPLRWYAEGFRGELARLGYTPGSVEVQIELVDRLSRWLAGEGLVVSVLDQQVVTHFLAVTEWGRQRVPTLRTFQALLAWLRQQGLAGSLRCQCCQPLMSYWLVTGLGWDVSGACQSARQPLRGHRPAVLGRSVGGRCRAKRGRGARRARRKPFLAGRAPPWAVGGLDEGTRG